MATTVIRRVVTVSKLRVIKHQEFARMDVMLGGMETCVLKVNLS